MDKTKDTFLLKDYVTLFGKPLTQDHPRVQENAKKIEETFKNIQLPEKLHILSQWLHAFEKKYFIITWDVRLSALRLIHCPQWIIWLWVIWPNFYITDMTDIHDRWKLLATPYVNHRFSRKLFALRTILPIGNDTFFVVVRSKYPAFWWPFLERLHLINLKERKCTTLPEEVGRDAQLIHYLEDEWIKVDDTKILIKWELVRDINEYLSACDDTRDMAESRSYRWPSFDAYCEIDRKTGKINMKA